MRRQTQNFISRQHMIANDFEFFHYEDSESANVEYHEHDFYEIFIMYSGTVSYMIEGKLYKLKPGDIVLISDKDLHKPIAEPDGNYERIVLWVNREFLKSISNKDCDLSSCFEAFASKKHNLLRPHLNQGTVIKSILSNLDRVENSVEYGDSILRQAYFMEFMVILNKLFFNSNDEEFEMDVYFNDNITNIVNYINDNLNSDLSVDVLSEKFFLSKYHLIREFKKNVGYTLHQYIILKRLILARGLLRQGLLVTEVCSKCGFNDYANFIRCFKKAFGVPPKKYASQ